MPEFSLGFNLAEAPTLKCYVDSEVLRVCLQFIKLYLYLFLRSKLNEVTLRIRINDIEISAFEGAAKTCSTHLQLYAVRSRYSIRFLRPPNLKSYPFEKAPRVEGGNYNILRVANSHAIYPITALTKRKN